MALPSLRSAVVLLSLLGGSLLAENAKQPQSQFVQPGIDLLNSTVAFTVRLAGVTVKGEFVKFGGTISIDSAHPENANIQARIETASIDTGNERRDHHLRSQDYFDAELYPAMTFRSTAVKKLADGDFDLSGDLTIKKTTKPIVLHVHPTSPASGWPQRWEATTQLNRKDFGVNSSALSDRAIGNRVDVLLKIQATRPL